MNDTSKNEPFHCGDQTALIAYLYDECDPQERDAIAAHLAACVACSAEVEALGATRRMLPAWTPPTPALGFQMTDAQASGPRAAVPSAGAWGAAPSRWWQRPLPAWAQAAAAALVFAAGLAAGSARQGATPSTAASVAQRDAAPPIQAAPVALAPRVAAVPFAPQTVASRDDLTRLERDLRAELARIERSQRGAGGRMADAASPTGADAAGDARVTMERVQALIQESELRQRQTLVQGMAEVIADFDTKRIRQLTPMRQTVEELRGETMTNRRELRILGSAVVGANQIVRTNGNSR
jgi:anti-sigma factor RsiW